MKFYKNQNEKKMKSFISAHKRYKYGKVCRNLLRYIKGELIVLESHQPMFDLEKTFNITKEDTEMGPFVAYRKRFLQQTIELA